MKASNSLWKQKLAGSIAPELASELDIYDNEVLLRKTGKIDEKVFAETRLRRGAYGQRYDNGHRHDGVASRTLDFAPSDTSKGPGTLWDANGMQRIKIPFGGMNAAQLETMAELAEEYSDGIGHITTRQDFQLHFVHIEDTPALMRRLAASGITTREACGNTIRNVTGCPIAGVCRDQSFDVTPYASALTYFLLGHPDCQDFGRKFKISFSGCRDHACALAHMHDLGAVAAVRDGKRGFEIYVGGGLGSVPQQAKLFDEFLSEEELLPTAQAMARVFARLGEKKNRNTARLKFLITKLGLDEFKRLVKEERALLAPDPRWTSYLKDVPAYKEEALKAGSLLQVAPANRPEGFDTWKSYNVYQQRQSGYSTVTIALALGDITSAQLRALADVARAYTKETIRTTVEQNMVLRWVSDSDLVAVYNALKAAGLARPGASTISDVVACPGTDTCKLGISSSRGLAGELTSQLSARDSMDESVRNLHIKVSGCFNSCGQHHICDLGFYGVSRNKGGFAVPHFQVMLGGQWENNAGSYGLAIGAVPSKRIPEVVDRITSRYVSDRQAGESFHQFVKRIGKAACKAMIEDFTSVPAHDSDPSYYIDWADAREYSIGDIGIGECAGEVISPIDFQLAACERLTFEAQLALEAGEVAKASSTAYAAMVNGAKALVGLRVPVLGDDPETIVANFRTQYHDTQLFFDPFAGAKFAQYFFQAHERRAEAPSAERTHQLIEEAQLFIEAAHACYARMSVQATKQ